MKFETTQHFLDLAHRGRHPAASGGEKRAARLARRLKQDLDDLAGMDASAVDGFCTLAKGAAGGAYDAVDTLLKAFR